MNRLRLISRNALIQRLVLLVGLAALATLPLYGSIYATILLSTVFMYVILTLSWAIFSGPTGQISLATAAFLGIGIYIAATLGKQLPLLVVVLAGGLASSAMAFLVGSVTLRLKGVYFTIFTFGLLELMKYLLLWYEVTFTGTRGRFVVVVEHSTIYFIMLAIMVLTVLTAYLIRRSKFGLALQAIGEQDEAAEHIGINVTLVKVSTFGISAFFMGAAGAIMATRWTYVDPYIAFNMNYSFTPVLMAIFGGLGPLGGPVVGAVIFAYLEQILITRFPYFYMLLFGIVMVISVVFLPQGMAGLIQQWRLRGMEGKYAHS